MHRRRTKILSLGMMALASAACLDKPTAPPDAKPVTPSKPALTISDAARDAHGIPGFFFRPPMLPVVAYPGTFVAPNALKRIMAFQKA